MKAKSAENSSPEQPIVVLGAGINGAAIARELALNGHSVWVVDQHDFASGTTAYSSRLIHGGLRYLEHGDFALVAESLAERQRLLRLAPYLVEPLRLFIPVEHRSGGWINAIFNFVGLSRWTKSPSQRGLGLIRMGLRFYDWIARDRTLPKWSQHKLDDPASPPVNPQRFHWLCAYSDAQIRFPERLVAAMLRDAELASDAANRSFKLLTYHSASLNGDTLQIRSVTSSSETQPVLEIKPALIVNATGAWVDSTLKRLDVKSERLIGGTKGSHFITFNPQFVSALKGNGVYAEAPDGRPVFLLPFGSGALIGTTDIRYDDDPGGVRAADNEIDYLLATASEIFPSAPLTRSDVAVAYCGVRPLPFVGPTTPAGISRRSQVIRHPATNPPLISVVGGKLTTCRALGEEVAQAVCAALNTNFTPQSRTRPIPGATSSGVAPGGNRREMIQRLAARIGATENQAMAIWHLCGEQVVEWRSAQSTLPSTPSDSANPESRSVVGTHFPRWFVRQIIQREWVYTLVDLVERRLMLVFEDRVNKETLRELAELLVEENRLTRSQIDQSVDACVTDLADRFGRRVY